MQYDYERAAAIINAFRDLVMEIKSIDNACQTEIKEADMAFCDIRHKCEIDYPKNRSTRTKICRLMKEDSVRRRNAKETLEVITPLVRFLDKNTHVSNLIGQMANETRKALENTRRSDGKGVMRFKPGSPLEWFYPAASLELNRLDAYDRGISDEWVKLSVYEDIFESKDYYVVR